MSPGSVVLMPGMAALPMSVVIRSPKFGSLLRLDVDKALLLALARISAVVKRLPSSAAPGASMSLSLAEKVAFVRVVLLALSATLTLNKPILPVALKLVPKPKSRLEVS